jgi:hypothetical protein
MPLGLCVCPVYLPELPGAEPPLTNPKSLTEANLSVLDKSKPKKVAENFPFPFDRVIAYPQKSLKGPAERDAVMNGDVADSTEPGSTDSLADMICVQTSADSLADMPASATIKSCNEVTLVSQAHKDVQDSEEVSIFAVLSHQIF